MSAPSIRELCQRATPGPWMPGENRPTAIFFDLKEPLIAECNVSDWDATKPIISRETALANAQLIARLSPDVVLKVVEALETAERYLYVTPLEGALTAHTKVETALRLLNATAQPTGEQSQ